MLQEVFHVIHVFSIIALVGTIFSAAAAPILSRRKKALMWSGIASLGVFISGFGMAGLLKIGFPIWVIVKILCWLLLSGIVGMFFRKPQNANQFLLISLGAVLVALAMVYFVR